MKRSMMNTVSNGRHVSASRVEVAHVDNEDDDKALFAHMRRLAVAQCAGRAVWGQQWHHDDIAQRAQLAGEPHRRMQSRPVEHGLFARMRLPDRNRALHDADAAGGAASSSPADAGMRDTPNAARLQHAEPDRHADIALLRIGDEKCPAPALPPEADGAGKQDQADEPDEADNAPVAPDRQRRVLGRRPDLSGLQVGCPPGGIVRQRLDRAAALVVAEQRQNRQNDGGAEQHGHPARDERL